MLTIWQREHSLVFKSGSRKIVSVSQSGYVNGYVKFVKVRNSVKRKKTYRFKAKVYVIVRSGKYSKKVLVTIK